MAITKSKDSSKRTRILKAVLALAVVAVLVAPSAAAVFYYKKYNQLNKMTAEQFSKRENNRILSEIKKVYNLPQGEEPSTIATVSDKEALKKQYPFFDQAENGDVVLIYTKAQLALIYRPSTKQVVKSGPINTQAALRVKVIGDETARKALTKSLTDNKVTATDGGNAKTTVSGVIVVDISGKNAEQAKTLAQFVKGQVGQLPQGEDTPTDADLLVITGPQTP